MAHMMSVGPVRSDSAAPPSAEVDPVRDLLGMRSRGSYAVAYGFFAAGCLLTYGSLRAGTPIVATVVPLLLLAVGGAVLLGVDGDPLPRWATAVVMGIPVAQALSMLPAMPIPLEQPLRLAVAFGGGAVLCAFLCIRGRVAPAWISQLIVFVVALGSAVRSAAGLEQPVGQLLSSTGLMVTATLFAWLVRPAAAVLYRLRAAQTRQLAERAAADAARIEHSTQKARLDDLARPLLVAIAEDSALSDDDISRTGLLEARLRDGIRARSLDVASVTSSTWAARERGVQVRLLDDSGSDHPTASDSTTLARLHEEIVTHLDRAVEGEVIVRVQPPHRPVLATITTNTSAGVAIHEIAAAHEGTSPAG